MSITSENFGTLPDGREALKFTLTNHNGVRAVVTNYGATWVSMFVPDRDGQLEDILLGFDTLEDYATRNSVFFGGIIGRCANRIAKGQFTIDGVNYAVAVNDPPNHLHGGNEGFDKKLWRAQADAEGVTFTRRSPDGEENYPGNLDCSARYALTDDNELAITYRATTDQATVVNLTSHGYFNLTGKPGTVHDHVLALRASQYTPKNDENISTGEIAPVAGTVMDFLTPRVLRSGIDELGWYDHNYVVDPTDGHPWQARLEEPASGRVMELRTTQPGVHFYSGIYLDGVQGKAGTTYGATAGLCLEAQHYPNSINEPGFPSVILRPGEAYSHTTSYRFATA